MRHLFDHRDRVGGVAYYETHAERISHGSTNVVEGRRLQLAVSWTATLVSWPAVLPKFQASVALETGKLKSCALLICEDGKESGGGRLGKADSRENESTLYGTLSLGFIGETRSCSLPCTHFWWMGPLLSGGMHYRFSRYRRSLRVRCFGYRGTIRKRAMYPLPPCCIGRNRDLLVSSTFPTWQVRSVNALVAAGVSVHCGFQNSAGRVGVSE
jgi:hypothetical protein